MKRKEGELDELLALQSTHTGRIKEQDLELTQLRERAQSLDSRNENLFETTELAIPEMDRSVTVLVRSGSATLAHGRDTARALIERTRDSVD